MSEPVFDPQSCSIEGTQVRLAPLEERHAAALFEAARDPDIWTYLIRAPFKDVADVRDWIAETVERAKDGSEIPFIILGRGDRALGSTRIMDIRREDRALEIGWTWLSAEAQRTRVNTECKYLLFERAFERWGARRVQLKTDLRNHRAQRAIERLGAVREGVLRSHMQLWNGYVRDTVYYSVIAHEWPPLRHRLRGTLGLA